MLSHFSGIDKPEALKENLADFWPRRIDEHIVLSMQPQILTSRLFLAGIMMQKDNQHIERALLTHTPYLNPGLHDRR